MLTEKQKKFIANYEIDLAMPQWKFVLAYGVVSWGIPMAAVITLVNILFFSSSFSAEWINFILFPVGGILFGILMRMIYLKHCRKLKASESEDK